MKSALATKRANGTRPAAGGLGVLAADADAPEGAKAAVEADLLHALEVIADFGVEGVGHRLRVATVAVVLPAVEEPVGDAELTWVGDNDHKSFKFLSGELASTLLHAHLGLLAGDVGEAAADALDLCEGVLYLVLPLDVCVQHADDVLEILRHLFPRNPNLTISCTRIYCKTQEENLLCSLTDGTFSSPLSSRLQQGA